MTEDTGKKYRIGQTYRKPNPAAVAEFNEVFGFTPTYDNLPFLAELRLTTKEIGGLLGRSHQAISYALERCGLSNVDQERRREVLEAQRHLKRQRQKTLEILCGQLNQHIRNTAEQEGLAAQRAVAYSERREKCLPYGFKDLITFFQRYQRWIENDSLFSGYKDFVKGLPYTAPTGRRMIMDLGLPLSSSTHDFLTMGEKAALQRIYGYRRFTMNDIAHFLGRRDLATINNHYKSKYGGREATRYSFRQDNDNRRLTCYLASEIYSGEAAELPAADIAEIVDTSLPLVQYALEEGRKRIVPVIVEGLRRLTGTDITRPYLLEEDRRRLRGDIPSSF